MHCNGAHFCACSEERAAQGSVTSVDPKTLNPCTELSLLQARFPGVAAARAELVDARAALEGLLPEMRRALKQPRLQYTSVINQGDHMIELPVDFRGVPKVLNIRMHI